MKITNIQAIYPNYPQTPGGWRSHLWQIVVKIETDVGVIGWGYGGGGLAAVTVINHHFRGLLSERAVNSLNDIQAIWDDLYHASIPYGRKGIAIMALSGVDLALWDLLAKAEKVPVYQLLGGKQKEKVRAYASGRDVEWYAELGFTAHKLPHKWTGNLENYEQTETAMAKARRLLGPEALLMIDGYMSWDLTVTQEMHRYLRPYDLYWFEDVLTPDLLEEQAALKTAIAPIKLAGGEHEFTHHGFADIARTQALDIWQPDVTWCGGITALLRILELAKTVGVPVVLHRGGEVWGLHVIAATMCDDLGELLQGNREDMVTPLWLDEPKAVQGYLTLSDAPGFGVKINPQML